jgi:hypothetical protein
LNIEVADMRVAIIENGIVINVAVWPENNADWPVLQDGVTALPSNEAGPGWIWTKKKGFIEPAREPDVAAVQPDIVVSARQFRLALLDLDLLDGVDALVADQMTPREIKIAWEYTTEFSTASPLWGQMLALAGKTQSELDAVFAIAMTK